MNALALLLKRVAKRVLANNPTNEVMLSTADRVVAWAEADYIGEAEVGEIADAVADAPALDGWIEADKVPGEEPEADAEPEAEAGAETEAEVDAEAGPDLGSMTKRELRGHAESLGLAVGESWTKAEIAAAVEAAREGTGEPGEEVG